MSYTKENLSEKNKLQFIITVDPETIKASHDKAVNLLGRDAKVAGFRKGHVPAEVLARNIDPARLAEAELNEAINISMVEIIEKEDLQLLDQPAVEVTKYVPSNTIELKATIEVVPPVKLVDPTKLTSKLAEAKVSDKEIDDVIENLRASSADKKLVDRAAKNGDEVVIDFTGLTEGKEFAGGKAKDYSLKLGSGSFIPGFEKGIVGHKAGDKFDLPVKFPAEYGAKELAGKDAVFKVELKKVNELTLPAVDDKFASNIAPDFKKIDDLRADIKRELSAREEGSNKQKFEDDLLAELGEKSQVEVPEILVKDQLPQMEQQFSENLTYRGLSLEGYLKQEGMTHDAWVEKELTPSATRRVRNSMVLTQLAKDQKITVSDDEVSAYQANVLAQYNDPKLKANFETPEALRQMKQRLVTEKTLAKLVDLNSARKTVAKKNK